jgi:hypothetical protein
MADLWLEKELARQLAPVTAPESLWDRINRQQLTRTTDMNGLCARRPSRRALVERAFWPVAVAMLVLAFAGVLRTLSADRGPGTFTQQEFALLRTSGGASGGFDFRSDNFEATRTWVKAEANIDIDLPAGQSAADPALHPERVVRLVGVRIVQLRGLPIAAIDYRVGDEVATLFVSGKHAGLTGNAGASRHLFSRVKTAGDARLYSWSMRNQTYTIAFSGAGNSRAACMLCHSNTPG